MSDLDVLICNNLDVASKQLRNTTYVLSTKQFWIRVIKSNLVIMASNLDDTEKTT
jgi:hypothetical protein